MSHDDHEPATESLTNSSLPSSSSTPPTAGALAAPCVVKEILSDCDNDSNKLSAACVKESDQDVVNGDMFVAFQGEPYIYPRSVVNKDSFEEFLEVIHMKPEHQMSFVTGILTSELTADTFQIFKQQLVVAKHLGVMVKGTFCVVCVVLCVLSQCVCVCV